MRTTLLRSIALLFLFACAAAASAPTISSTSPSQNQLNISATANITITFDQAMDNATLTSSTIKVSGNYRGFYTAAFSYGSNSVTINPDSSFKPGEVITVTVTTGVQNSSANEPMASPRVYNFTVDAPAGYAKFRSPDNYTAYGITGGNHYMVLADLDNDGDIDIATTIATDAKISVMLNNGDGTYASAVTYSTKDGSSSFDITAADVDGDGDMDLLVANNNAYGLSVFVNNGSGSFSTRNDYAFNFPQSNAQFLVAVDIDGDGDIDVVENDLTNNYLHVMKNDGSGAFSSTGFDFALTTKFGALAAGDLDKDGDMDIVAATAAGDSVEYFVNDGTGNLSLGTRFYWTHTNGATGVLVADINSISGNKQDLVYLASGTNYLTYFKDNGAALNDAAEVSVGGYPVAVSAADVDTDNDLDLLVANYNDATFSLLTNTGSGTGTFTQTTYTIPSNPDDLSTADIDGDGDMDVVTINSNATISVFQNYNGGHVSSVTPANGSINTDSTTNVTVVFDENINSSTLTSSTVKITGSVSGVHSWTLSSYNSGTYTATLNPTMSFAPGEVVTVSISTGVQNGNSIALEKAYSSAFVVEAGGAGAFGSATNYTAGTQPKSVIFPDLNADGHPDLVTVNNGSANVSVRLNNGDGTYGSESLLSTGTNPTSVAAGDVDGDGDVDLMVTVTGADQLARFLNNGSGSFGAATTFSTATGPTSISLGDIDGDGDLDVVYIAGSQGFRQSNDGTGAFSDEWSFSSASAGITLADVDNDGDLDVLIAYSSTFYVNYNSGSGVWNTLFSGSNSYSTGNNLTGIIARDFNGDGYVDVVTTNLEFGTGTISYLQNNQNGTFATKVDYIVGSGAQPRGLTALDIDGDGDLDIVAANGAGNSAVVFKNNGSGVFTKDATYSTGTTPYSIAVADVDGDGDMDVATANYGGDNISVLLGVPVPSVTTSAVSSVGTTVATLNGTVNANGGTADAKFVYKLSTSGSYADTISASPSSATGSSNTSISAALTGLQSRKTYNFKALGIVSGKTVEGSELSFTTDSVIVASTSPARNSFTLAPSGNLTVTFNVSMNSSTMTSSTIFVSGSITGPHAGSISYDGPSKTMTFDPTSDFARGEIVTLTLTTGIQDAEGTSLIASQTFSSTVAAGGTGAGHFNISVTGSFFSNNEHDFLSADVDNDGDADLIGKYQNITVSKNNGGSFDAPTVQYYRSSSSVYPYEPRFADMDNDGYGDLVLLQSNDSNFPYVVILKNNGSGTFSRYDSVQTQSPWTYGLDVNDYNNDGKPDIAYMNSGSSVYVSYNTAGWTNNVTLTAAANSSTITSADVDNDGDIDLIVYGGSSVISLLKNNGNGTFASAVTISSNSYQIIKPVDVNGDGYVDLITDGNGAKQFSVLMNNGDGTFASPTTYALSIQSVKIIPGDFNGDGAIDLAFAYQNESTVAIAYNNGSGVFNQQLLFPQLAADLAAMDYDNDGDIDLVGSNNANGLVVLTNSIVTAPTSDASSLSFSNNYGSQVKLSWTNGNGSRRIVVVKQGSAVDGTPSTNTTYTANATFGSGNDLGGGNYVVYNGTGSQVIISGLTTNTNYYFSVMDYNGLNGSEVYKTPGATNTVTTNATAGFPFDTTAGYAMQYTSDHWDYNINSFTLPSAFTVEMWVNPSSIGSDFGILTFGQSGDPSAVLQMGIDATGKFNSWIYDENATSNVTVTGTSTASANQWYHVAVTGGTGSPLKLYVNGILEGTSGGNIGLVPTSSGTWWIGGDWNNTNFSGQADEFRYWSAIRPADSIRANMHKTLSGFPDNIAGYWQFNDGVQQNSTYDLVGENPMDNTDGGSKQWIASTVPVGGATIASTTSFQSGSTTVGNASLNMADGFDNPVDVYVTEISGSPSSWPTGFGSATGGKYFVIELFGDPGTFNANITLNYGPGVITTAQQSDPSTLRLFKRPSTSTGSWTDIGGAISADSSTGQVTWAGITSFSQFMSVDLGAELPPTLTITKSDGTDWTNPENQDRITDSVWLTRGNNGGLFNIKTETSFNSSVSPDGTEWALGTIADGLESLTFDTFYNLRNGMGGSLSNLPGHDVVLHLITENKYLDVHFNSWSSGGNGGFSYTRSLKDLELIQSGYSNLAATSVTVSGQMYSKSTTASAWVLYGTASGVYPDSVQITPTTIPSDTVYSISKSLTGLTEGTTYFYRFAASNGSLYARSSERSVRPHEIQVWSKNNGTMTFTKADNADWTLEANQDRLNADVAITRANSQGLFNILSEGGYSHNSSPAGTEWAYGAADNYQNLTFHDWETTNGANPPSMVGQDMVLHLIDEDIYLDIKFTAWTQSGGGGFSYDRAVAPLISWPTSASGATSNTATVGGSVYSHGLTASAKFLYGTSSGNYPDSVAATPGSIDSSSQTAISANLSSLLPGTMYYYKTTATNSSTFKRSNSEGTFMTMSSSAGNALKFDGNNDYVEVSDNNALDLTSSYTLEAWIKPEGFSSMAGIISKYQSNGANGYFIRLSNNSPYTGIRFDEQETASGILTAGTWVHIAAVNDNGTRTLYVNGSPVSFASTQSYTTGSNSDPIRIGSDFGGRYFNGAIDEVRVWNVARTQQQIQDNMDTPFSSPQSGLVLYLQNNESSGTTAHNFGTTSDGVLTNFDFNSNDGWVESNNAALPIELTSFTGESERLNANLKWETATEVNNSRFEIERTFISDLNAKEKRSTSANTWAKAGFVDGGGTSNKPKEYSFKDKLQKPGKYSYRLKQIDNDGKIKYSQAIEVEVGIVPNVFTLNQNYPNPFNPSTTIGFTLEQTGMTTLKIYNTLGQEVATLVNEPLKAGEYHQVQFNASALASGVYFARLQSSNQVQLKKMLLLK